MRPVIIALGRSDNHALLATHARHLGVEYQGLEAEEASEYVREPAKFEQWLAKIPGDGPVHIAAIDMSVAPSTLRSFLALMESKATKGKRTQFIPRTDPALLEAITTTVNFRDSHRKAERNTDHDSDSETLYLLSIARSPHNQIAIWPMIELTREGKVRAIKDGIEENSPTLSDDHFSDLIDRVIADVSSLSLVGVINYVFDPLAGNVIRAEFGLSTFTFWSESASYTSVSEQMIRAILDLPLGDCRMIDFEEFFLQEEVELDPNVIQDPIRPFLHLFARNPRFKVKYHQGDRSESVERIGAGSGKSGSDPSRLSQESAIRFATLSLFASSQQEALDEMAHARDFMLGR